MGLRGPLACSIWTGPQFHLHPSVLFALPFALARTRARQAVFVFILHLFTGMPQKLVAQRVRGEGFGFFRFTAAIDGIYGG